MIVRVGACVRACVVCFVFVEAEYFLLNIKHVLPVTILYLLQEKKYSIMNVT